MKWNLWRSCSNLLMLQSSMWNCSRTWLSGGTFWRPGPGGVRNFQKILEAKKKNPAQYLLQFLHGQRLCCQLKLNERLRLPVAPSSSLSAVCKCTFYPGASTVWMLLQGWCTENHKPAALQPPRTLVSYSLLRLPDVSRLRNSTMK